MSATPAAHGARPHGRGAVALALCGLLGVIIGLTAGLNIARRMVPAATEARLVMQLLELEQIALNADAVAGKCAPLPPERLQALTALIDLIPLSMRDTLVVDTNFKREVQRLRKATLPLADARQGGDCRNRRRVLDAIDAACRDCHREYRTEG